MIANGDLVTRKSYRHDIIFRVMAQAQTVVKLMGEHVRLEADAPLDDLEKVTGAAYHRIRNEYEEQEAYSYRLFRQDYRLLKEKRDAEAGTGYTKESETNYFQLPPGSFILTGTRCF